MSHATSRPDSELHRHPVRGCCWSLLLGLGVALILVVTKVIELALVPLIVVVATVLVVGTLWGAYGPARAPTGPPPMSHHRVPPPDVSRFDDFTDATPTGTPAPPPDGTQQGG